MKKKLYKIRLQKGFLLNLATNDRSDKMFMLTSKFCPQGIVSPCPGALYMCKIMKKNCIKSDYRVLLCLPPHPPVGLGNILFLLWSSVHLSVTKSCPLCNSKTVRDIFMKLYTNVKQQETTCRAQEPWLWIAYFWSYGPLELKIVDFAIWSCPLYLYNSKTVQGTFMELHTNINQH